MSQIELRDLVQEYENFISSNSPDYIGDNWWLICNMAIHGKVCSIRDFPHRNQPQCLEKMPARSYGFIEWESGLIADLGYRLLKEKIIPEGLAVEVLTCKSTEHAKNFIARVPAHEFLWQIQSRKTDAGKTVKRMQDIYDSRGQYFSKTATDEPYFSLDGTKPDPNKSRETEAIAIKLVSQWPVIVHPDREAGGIVYSHRMLEDGSKALLHKVFSIRKYGLHNIFTEIFARREKVTQIVGVRSFLTGGHNVANDDFDAVNSDTSADYVMDVEGMLKFVTSTANEIFLQLDEKERKIWRHYQQAPADELVHGLSRQTFAYQRKKIAQKIVDACENASEARNFPDLSDEHAQGFCIQVMESVAELIFKEVDR